MNELVLGHFAVGFLVSLLMLMDVHRAEGELSSNYIGFTLLVFVLGYISVFIAAIGAAAIAIRKLIELNTRLSND